MSVLPYTYLRYGNAARIQCTIYSPAYAGLYGSIELLLEVKQTKDVCNMWQF